MSPTNYSWTGASLTVEISKLKRGLCRVSAKNNDFFIPYVTVGTVVHYKRCRIGIKVGRVILSRWIGGKHLWIVSFFLVCCFIFHLKHSAIFELGYFHQGLCPLPYFWRDAFEYLWSIEDWLVGKFPFRISLIPFFSLRIPHVEM